MRIILKSSRWLLVSLILVLINTSAASCSSSVPTTIAIETAPASSSAVILPTIFPSSTSTPSLTASSMPTEHELLDMRTRFLFGDPASVVIEYLLEIQEYVRVNNKERLAGLILYPITIHSIDGNDIEILTGDEFVANYEKIVTPKWKEIILAQEPLEISTSWQGVMVHRGELWFAPICLDTACQEAKYYIVSITNDTPW